MAEISTDKNSLHYASGNADEANASHEINELHELTHKLRERIKELNCLYSISQLVEQNLTLDAMMKSVVDLIPPSWQYPDITCARIKLNKQTFTTDNFHQTDWRLADTICVNGKTYGIVEVYYLEEKPPQDEGPFLNEERHLIHMIAERLGHVIERKLVEIRFESLYKRERKLRQKLQNEMNNRVAFTRNLVHELKTPLTSLMATSQLLMEETEGNQWEKLSRFVWEGTNNLNNRINKLHDVVKGETGDLEVDLAPFDMGYLVRAIADETQALARQNDIALLLDIEPSLPPAYGDESRTGQVILNLLNNAFKYAGAGEKVIIKANREGDAILIEIRDLGPGIPQPELQKIFKPGYQRHHDKTTGGLGIGLSLCKLLVGLQNGKIWAKSRLKKGSSFFFTIPIYSKVETDTDTPSII